MRKTILYSGIILIVFLFSAASLSQLKDDNKKDDRPTLKELMEKGRYEELLIVADKALSSNPSDPFPAYYKISALDMLGRYQESGSLAVKYAKLYPRRLEFRYFAGEAMFKLGYVEPAIRTWEPLKYDPYWAESGCRLLVKALLAEGHRSRAGDLVEETIARIKKTPVGLLRLRLDLSDRKKIALETLSLLIKEDPENSEEYRGKVKLLEMADGEILREMSFPESYPVEVPVRMKSERGTCTTPNKDSRDADSAEIRTTPCIVVPASVNRSRRKWLVFDSGSNNVLIGANWAKELRLKGLVIPEGKKHTSEKTGKSVWVMLKRLKVGPVVFRNVTAKVINERHHFFGDIGGIIPFSLFEKVAICLDKRHRKLTIYKSGTAPASVMGKRAFRIDSIWVDEKPFIRVSLNSRPSRYFLMDTGSYHTLLNGNKVASIGIKANSALYGPERTIGLRGNFIITRVGNIKLTIGTSSFVLKDVYVENTRSNWGIDYWGILGQNEILSYLKVFFDYTNNVIAFSPAG